MQIINCYCNPFLNHFRESIKDFRSLSLVKKVVAVATTVFGAFFTFYLLGIGGVALFQLSVKWLQTDQCQREEFSITTYSSLQRRKKRIAELVRLMHQHPEELRREAGQQGYTILSPENSTKFTGKGFLDLGSEIYKGGYVNGCFHGNGVYIRPFDDPPSVYQGNFSNGRISGKGLEAMDDGCWYEGEYDNAMYTNGTYRDSEHRALYSGALHLFNGITHIYWDSGDLFAGTGSLSSISTPDFFYGEGKLKLKSGKTFEGMIKITFEPSGFTFVGTGSMTFEDGSENQVSQYNEQVLF